MNEISTESESYFMCSISLIIMMCVKHNGRLQFLRKVRIKEFLLFIAQVAKQHC